MYRNAMIKTVFNDYSISIVSWISMQIDFTCAQLFLNFAQRNLYRKPQMSQHGNCVHFLIYCCGFLMRVLSFEGVLQIELFVDRSFTLK